MRARYVIAYIDATASFGSKLRVEKVRRNRIGTAISSLRHLGFGEEEKMRFSSREVMFHR